MARLFFRQFGALFVKNWIVLSKHPVVNLLRCLVLPVGLAVFLAYAQVFLSRPNKNGLGSMVPVASLADTFDPDLTLLWSDETDGAGGISPADIVSRVTRGFSGKQLSSVRKASTDDIATICRENFSGSSACFASVTFEGIPATGSNQTLNYTIRADSALRFVNVIDHSSDYERRILPLQWAIDSAIVELDTGVTPATPLEWPYTQSTNNDEIEGIRLAFVSFAANLLVIAFFLCFIGISYQLPGMAVLERASGMTSQMKAMGLLDSARVLSWHLSLSLAYLPAWLIMAGVWKAKLFTGTGVGIMIAIHILTGLSLTSWSMFVMAPFGKSPQLAAIVSTILALVWCVIGMVWIGISTVIAFILILFFPPIFLPVALRCVVGFEINLTPTSATFADPEYFITLWPLFLATIISIFVWPWLGALLERRLYDARNPSSGGCCGRRKKKEDVPVPPNVAISIRNLGKDFRTSIFKGKKSNVTAISDLSIDIPKYGIFVLLGPNGAGKSTVMSILGGLIGRTRGTVMFEGGVSQPPRGSIGLVPQKNVLFPELTCYQTLRLFKTIKPRFDDSAVDEDIIVLLRDCDLGSKVHYNAAALSGGQKRKLQLAIGLVGGSKIVLVDECTSGVDPLSRRSIWKTLTAVKNERTIVFTTHFLDEADLLADEIAVLAAPGKLVAHGNPVTLKSTLGDGYTMKVTYQTTVEKTAMHDSATLLNYVRRIAPETQISISGPDELAYHLKTHDLAVVRQVLEAVEREKGQLGIVSYAVSATSIEDIFLELMQEAEQKQTDSETVEKVKEGELSSAPRTPEIPVLAPAKIQLSSGTSRSVLGQALTIFHKRLLIARRSWLSYVLAMGVLLVASCVPLKFVPKDQEACQVLATQLFDSPLFFPETSLRFAFTDAPGFVPIVSPPDILSALGNSTSALLVKTLPDNATFVNEFSQHFVGESDGGISVDLQTGAALLAWNADFSTVGPIFLNTISNLLYNKALNDTAKAIGSPKLITPTLGDFPAISAGSLKPLEWAAFFGAAMAVFPAFFTLYVAQERRSSVQAMQFSNGLSNPAGLWLGHLLFDSMFGILCATILTIVFAAKSTLFQGLGYLWFIMVLYAYTGTLFAYLVSLWVTSPLAAFALTAVYQIIIFGLYLAAYMLSLTYSKAAQSGKNINIIHFTMSLLSPALNVARASFVSVNLFSLLCNGSAHVPTSSLGSITRYGGPILYLILYGLALFGILVYVDSGSVWKQKVLARARTGRAQTATSADANLKLKPDVLAEAVAMKESQDALRVLDVSKRFGRAGKVVDSVSFGVAQDTIFALLGPNGAGKTTTFNMIRGDLLPDAGEILINGRSVVRHTQQARLSLGVCPQFTAIDAQLTVREHLQVYARLKGLSRGSETQRNVHEIMVATGLDQYADRLASKLSGGNQRKLALAIALIGNPSVILIDEFSTGIDAKMKRDMWGTLKNVAHGKAIVITTHSMEEASTLANKVGILARRMLAVGPTDTLISRYARYLVHFPCRTGEDVLRAQALMARIPGAKLANDVATRFEVPVGEGLSLAQLFGIIAEATALEGTDGPGRGEWAVEEASLESVFMKVIRENEVEEGDGEAVVRRGWWRV